MKLTPLDVRKQTFKRGLRGYDIDEVETFLEMVSAEMEALIKQNASLADKLNMLKSQLDDYNKLERALRDSVLTAQKVTDASKQTANREAELIIKEAEAQAERIVDEYQKKVLSLKREMNDLKKQNNLYLSRMQSLVDTQLRILKYHEMDMESGETIPDLSTALSKTRLPGRKSQPEEDKAGAGTRREPERAQPARPSADQSAGNEPASKDIDRRLIME